MRTAVHAEWTKLRTLPGTGWLLVAVVVTTVALGALAAAAVECTSVGCSQDPVEVALTGVQLSQAVVAVLAVLAITGEYRTGMIRTTLAAMPRRSTVLAAKATVVSALVVAAATAGVLGSLLAGRLLLPGNGFTPEHGHAPLSLLDGPTLRAAVGSVLYLVLVALFSLGLATVVRDAAVAIGAVLGLLYLFPILIEVVTDPDWHRRLQQVAPMPAGLAIQHTVDVAGLPIGPWPGLGVLGVWAAVALIAGNLVLRRRDA